MTVTPMPARHIARPRVMAPTSSRPLLTLLVAAAFLALGRNSGQAAAAADDERLNILIITADQLRYDAVRFVQDRMAVYDGKVKVRTPNLDRLAAASVVFSNTYAQGLPCSPARGTLRSGCTIKRTGIYSNGALDTWTTDRSVGRRVNQTRTYDQILASVGYQAESYGKWHMPERWFDDVNETRRVIVYDGYSLDFEQPEFSGETVTTRRYTALLSYWSNTSELSKDFTVNPGDQINPRSLWPYTPVPISPLYGVNDSVSGFTDDNAVFGIDGVPSNYSQTSVIGRQATRAIKRLASSSQPWVLTVSFENPHPPYVVAADYASYYLENQDGILTPPSINDKLENSNYAQAQQKKAAQGFVNKTLVQGWTAVYYGMMEQVDAWVGNILDELDQQGVADQTLVVFTSDHGEFLGAHGLQGKFGLLEEALRVPFFIKLPRSLRRNMTIDQPVGHIDLLATLLDYTGFSALDQSNGKSLRPVIEKTSYRKYYENEFVVSEAGIGGNAPGFMVRLGRYKLLIARISSSTTQDLLFDLQTDPYEQQNILPTGVTNTSLIGIVEHRKSLLLEWMQRNDGGSEAYFSSSVYNNNVGRGDVTEVTARRTWPAVNQWISHTALTLNRPVFDDGKWRSNAWLYIGRTNSGTLKVSKITVTGTGQQYFSLSQTSAAISGGKYVRIKVAFVSATWVDPSLISVSLVIQSSVLSRQVVNITWS